ncbi:MAG: AgmX/PglI C-terminal domain-containing protein [Ignavibacteria bacterium]|nr:AgmX/PglI C-terminal domain-containing protein [Ignavibacteria bacterium]
MRFLSLALLLALVLAGGANSMAKQIVEDSTAFSNSLMLSPRFFVNSSDPVTDSLILKTTTVTTAIAGIIADIRIVQQYVYKGTKPLDAAYTVPLAQNSTMLGLIIRSGGNIIATSPQDREEANDLYDKLKKTNEPFFVDWRREKLFQVHVSAIPSNSTFEVEVHYTELLTPNNGIYQYRFPKVASPNFISTKNEIPISKSSWPLKSFSDVPNYPTGILHLSVTVSGSNVSIPLALTSPTHEITTKTIGIATTATLTNTDTDKDVLINYQLAGPKTLTNLLLFQGVKENYFLLALHPPLDTAGRTSPPHEYIILLDSTATDARVILSSFFSTFSQSLRPKDKINIVRFGSRSDILANKSLPATADNIRTAQEFLSKESAQSNPSKLLDGLQKCTSLPTTNGYGRSIIMLTNGFVSVNQETFDFIAGKLNLANIFAVGIGESTNPIFFNVIGHLTMSEPTMIATDKEVVQKATQFTANIRSSALSKVKVDFKGLEPYDIEPASYPDVLANRPVFIFGKWRGKLTGKITVRGNAADAPFVSAIDLTTIKPNESNIGLQYLWAQYRTSRLTDYNVYSRDAKRVQEISNLGMEYSLQTVYTSFAVAGMDTVAPGAIFAVVQPPVVIEQNSNSSSTSPGLSSTSVVEVAVSACSIGDAESMDEEGFISIGEVTVEEGLVKDAIKTQIDQQNYDIQLCYATALHHFRHLQGKAKMRVVVDAEGAVSEISLLDSELNIDELNQCIVDAIRKFKFTAPTNGATPAMTFWLIFEVI